MEANRYDMRIIKFIVEIPVLIISSIILLIIGHGIWIKLLGGVIKPINYMSTENLSLGEQRVRTKFNPSENDTVSQIKQKSAELINLCEELKAKDVRLASLAQTSYEEAAMWAVKAATS